MTDKPKKSRKPRSPPIDWLTLETEYVLSDPEKYPNRAHFFRIKDIPPSTWTKKALATWDLRRTAYRLKAMERATVLAGTKLAKHIADSQQLGNLLKTTGAEAFIDKETNKVKLAMIPANPVDAAKLIESGIDIEREALTFDTGPQMDTRFGPGGVQPIGIDPAQTIDESACIAEIESRLGRYMAKEETA